MRAAKKKKLEAAGWKVGNADEFLDLTPAESAFVDMKVRLALGLKEKRQKKRLTQQQLADLVESSQSRVAKMEAADESVSIDLLIRSLLALGASEYDLAKLIKA
jgi:predicted XRE-type DNA-binding protein